MERNEINNEQLNNLERNQALRKLVLEIYAKIQALIKKPAGFEYVKPSSAKAH
jgi:hypothetical protein